MKVVIDHVSGSRSGQRQELIGSDKVTFGRHPSCTVSFDAHRDLDASSRHAELSVSEEGARLKDVGSSNGTFVGGERLVEISVALGNRVVVEFGSGGPQVAIWVGRDADPPPPAPAFRRRGRLPRWAWVVIAALALAVLVGAIVQLS